ncbi:MAG TPA: monomeric [FeFe] hydrogenase [Treponemataceae bacterium]|jgi:[FeFe] hydrogenase (group B1/B3)|nr:monomeric [FeFe] hydrogenase [Treponemataceae bacterium]
MNLNNGTARIKREILVRLARLQLEGRLEEGVHFVPREMAPVGSEPLRCCVYHDREVLRMRVIARLGHSVEDYDDEKKLAEYAREAIARERPTEPMLTVLDEACNACVRAHYLVTNACQACVARPCAMNCPKKAIKIAGGRARIDEDLCVNCGLCMQNCPYHAIVKVPVPCEEACPVGAISKDESGKERIDYAKCTFCGACMRECPFGAMMDKGQLVDVIARIMAGKRVVALYAPAIAAQFGAAPGQLEEALARAGFAGSVEVALGADVTADAEAGEFEERMARGDVLMTTSCCPAYVRAVRVHAPALVPCVSETRSPMHYAAEIAKRDDPGCVSVFVGPCLAKRKEGIDDPLVDYVLSAEELGALFVAKGIEVAECPARELGRVPTATGRLFAKSGGVAEAVRARLADPASLRASVIDGLDRAGMRRLAAYGKAAAEKAATDANLVEVMACPGGCIAGPSVIANPKVALGLLGKYVSSGKGGA